MKQFIPARVEDLTAYRLLKRAAKAASRDFGRTRVSVSLSIRGHGRVSLTVDKSGVQTMRASRFKPFA